ncbi:MAG: DUF624 domain-containing protein [Oscillibacter sp.]
MKKKGRFREKIAAFFADTSPFMTMVGHIALLVVMNLCWLICSLPVVTVGASTAALYSVLLNFPSLSFDSAFKAFFQAFARRWKTATLLWIPYLAAGALLVLDWRLLTAQGLADNLGVNVLLLLAASVYCFSLQWLFPVLAATGKGVIATVKLAFLLGLRELWRSFLLVGLTCVPLFLFIFYAQTFMALWGCWLLFGFAVLAFLKSRLMAPILRALAPPNAAQETTAKRP